MVNNNKILTVSYGTFSCTLEGFDDSFGTMKAIAEYFRDLASDDRYFGAEPPQPDADMLARIAQREVTRRVEAHSENGGIVLRAHDQGAAPAAIAPIAAAVETPVEAEVTPEVIDEVAPEVVAEVVETENPVRMSEVIAEETPEATAEETLEVTAEQETAIDEDEINLDNSTEQEIAADEEPEAQVEAEFVADVEPIVEAQDEVDVVAEEVSATDDEDIAEASTKLETAEVADEEPEAEAIPLAEQMESDSSISGSSIAAKLKRIRAVVSRSGVIAEDNGYQEDEHAVDLVADTEDSIASAFDIEIDEVAEEEKSLAADPDEALEDLEEGEHSNLFMEDAADTNGDAQNDETPEVEDVLIEDEDSVTENEVSATEVEDSIEDEVSITEISARLIKVNRDELETAIANGEVEEIEGDSAEDNQEPLILDTSLSVEDEAELQRELAEVTVSPDEDNDFVEAATDNEVDTNDNPGAKLLTEAGNADDDLSRLMAETNSQMDEPESSQRRDAFSHLRAAVAATKAENILGNDDKNGDSAEAYKDDLASVVKPRRPEQLTARTERPVEARPAPLKLVAEQRIDIDDNEERGPVRPRRVASEVMQNGSATIEEETGGFVEFANNAGATQLPELLEAAASYMAFVEGREQFSRPQLMHKVRQVEFQNFSREDGLRSFGKLLRSGKIEKIRGGRFTVSGEIGFRPDPDDTREAG